MQLSPDEICRLAYAEKPLPSEATVVDRSLYAEVRRLYDAWSVSKMTKEACAAAKTAALFQYRKDAFDYDRLLEAAQAGAALYRDIDAAVTAYNLCPSRENADRMIEVIYHVKKKQAQDFLKLDGEAAGQAP